MLYSIDDRKSWQRFDVLGWDRFLGLVAKSGLGPRQLVSYLRLPADFAPPIRDLMIVPMLFQRKSEASDGLRAVITQLVESIRQEDPREFSVDQLRRAIGPLTRTLTDSQLAGANSYSTLALVHELESLNSLLESYNVWVAWPNARRSLQVSSRPEVDNEGKRLFDNWRIFTSARRWGLLGDSPEVHVVLRRPKQPDDKGLSALQKSALWRSTHLVAIQAFADFAICLLYPKTARPQTPAVGGAIAVRSVMELTAHYLNSPGDPFDSGEDFPYRENLKSLGLEREYDAICECFKAESFWEPSNTTEKSTWSTCDKALRKVWNVLNTSESTSATQGLATSDTSVGFEPIETHELDYWRTSIDRKDLDSQIEVAAFGYEWLCDLWTKEQVSTESNERLPITPYEVNTRVFCWNLKPLIESVERYRDPARPEYGRPLSAIGALLRAFCLASNLAPLCAGAIARELHLHVEKLLVRANRDCPYDDTMLKKIRKSPGTESMEYRTEKEKQEDKSLKCIEGELLGKQSSDFPPPDLNPLRVCLQDVLQSFAHPGWLIRTETAWFSEPEPEISEVRISSRYRSPFAFADIDGLTQAIRSYPYAQQRETNSFYALFREHVPRDVSEAMRNMFTQRSDAKTVPGSAYEIPYAAVQICAVAIKYFLRVGPKNKTDC